MFSEYVHVLSLLLWIGIIAAIVNAIARAIWLLIRCGDRGTVKARQCVAEGIITGLGLSTAIALLATTQLRSWRAIGTFAATAALRSFIKYAEKYIASESHE
jgi:hypothetical protein